MQAALEANTDSSIQTHFLRAQKMFIKENNGVISYSDVLKSTYELIGT